MIGMTPQSASGAITGSHVLLGNPRLPTPLADVLDSRARLFRYNPSLPSTIYVATTGNDTTGTGLIGAPFLTIDRALQFIGLNNPANVTISMGAGTFTMPTVLTNLYNITFNGTVSTVETVPVASITSQSNATQLVFTITRTPTLANDAWRGKLISFTTAGTLTRGWVYRNVGNTLYVVVNVSLAAPQLTTSSTVSLLSLDSNLQYTTGNNTLSGCSLVQVTGCQITGTLQGRIPFFVATDKWQFNDCYFAVNRPQVGQAGGAFIFRSYINSLGDTTEGVLSVVRGGNLRFGQGSVIDTQNAAANEKFIRVAQDAKLSFDGQTVCRGLEARGFSVEGASAFVEAGVDALDLILFEDTGGTTTGSCAGAFTINTVGEGVGGTLQLPALYGHITGNYAVSATKDAYVRYVSTSTLVTALGTNYVSADAGTSTSCRNADGTQIIGAFPTFSAEFDQQVNLTFANSPYITVLTTEELHIWDTTGGVCVDQLPAANTYQKGSGIWIKSLNNGSANALNVTPNGLDTIDLVAAVYPLAAGQSAKFVSDGINNWNVL